MFDTRLNIALTLGALLLLAWALPPLARWLVLDAVWSGPAGACSGATGACWAFVAEKARFILLGLYPVEQDWRPVVAAALLVALIGGSMLPYLWRPWLVLAWIAVPLAAVVVMAGTGSGAPVSTQRWGGLPLTLLLSATGFAGAFPLAVLLALARQSRMAGVRLLAIGFIETLRGVPFIAVLYASTLLFPLMLPAGSEVDKLLRAQAAIILFVAAYLAEIIRSGLQAVPRGQYEAARSLGLGYWKSMGLVILPQALRISIPALVNLAVGLFQDTTLVAIIGIHDMLSTARMSATDSNWIGFYAEAFLFVGILYFGFCFAGSRYSLWLEHRVNRAHRP